MRGFGVILFLVLPILLNTTTNNYAYGQLISPGKLSTSHQQLEGITNCTSCHELGSKGIQNKLCLNCHTPLQSRIEQQRGYHATVADQNCGNCHKEHFGREFNAVNWDTTRFDHDETGYPLEGKHLDLNCSTCHTPTYITDKEVMEFKNKHLALEGTFLGLGTECETCHNDDSPHGIQFLDQTCADCHNPNEWTDMTQFDHNKTRYKLVGKHVEVECSSCHPSGDSPNGTSTLYSGFAFEECSDCHEDVHGNRLGKDCSGCHFEQGWHQFTNFPEKRFPHEETGFILLGRHAVIDCSSCHTPGGKSEEIALSFSSVSREYTYPHPEAENCLSCHLDYHKGVFAEAPGGSSCDNCHTSESWLPSEYNILRHNRESRFKLTGAHSATPCFSCHQNTDQGILQFVFEDTGCETCHEADNPHGDEFVGESGRTPCADCHTTEAWSSELFNHDATDFPLTGAHMVIACTDCHTPPSIQSNKITRRFDNLTTNCKSCHLDDDPHQNQFAESSIGQECNACHDTQSFRLTDFDHSRTRFSLDGAHIDVPCISCHTTERTSAGEPFTRFRPMEITCESCHANER